MATIQLQALTRMAHLPHSREALETKVFLAMPGRVEAGPRIGQQFMGGVANIDPFERN